MSNRLDENAGRLLTPAEVAVLFRVDPKTVARWAQAGKIGSIRTLGGHRRFWESEVRSLLERASNGATTEPPATASAPVRSARRGSA